MDALTSNIGHVLWSGVASPARAEATVERLLSSELWSGWGIRTMSASDDGYNPLGYHVGTVWPHDNALVAEGMRRYGFREEASQSFAAGAPLLALRTLLGLDAEAGHLHADPVVPESVKQLTLAGVHVHGRTVDAG